MPHARNHFKKRMARPPVGVKRFHTFNIISLTKFGMVVLKREEIERRFSNDHSPGKSISSVWMDKLVFYKKRNRSSSLQKSST